MPDPTPTVLVAATDPSLLEEVVRYLEEIPQWHAPPPARSADELMSMVPDAVPDAILIDESIAIDLASRAVTFGAVRCILLSRSDSPDALRAALRIGARGAVQWPGERKQIRALVTGGIRARASSKPATGELTAVWGPKGGSGTSVLSAHIAAGVAASGASCMLADLDLDHGDQSAILGCENEAKSIVDLLRVVDEITPATVDSVVWRHPLGFGAVLSPGSPGESSLVKPGDIIKSIAALRETTQHVIADVPTGYSDLLFAVAEEATRVLVVVTPDLLSLRRARDAMKALNASGIDAQRFAIVVNQYVKGDITVDDVATVTGRPVVATIKPHLALYRSPGRGELSEAGRRLLSGVVGRVLGLPAPELAGLGNKRFGRS